MLISEDFSQKARLIKESKSVLNRTEINKSKAGVKKS
jgi:hypothetical protein